MTCDDPFDALAVGLFSDLNATRMKYVFDDGSPNWWLSVIEQWASTSALAIACTIPPDPGKTGRVRSHTGGGLDGLGRGVVLNSSASDLGSQNGRSGNCASKRTVASSIS